MFSSEKEKMQAGEYYNPLDEELTREREYAKRLIFELNMAGPGEQEKDKVF